MSTAKYCLFCLGLNVLNDNTDVHKCPTRNKTSSIYMYFMTEVHQLW